MDKEGQDEKVVEQQDKEEEGKLKYMNKDTGETKKQQQQMKVIILRW